MELRGQGSGVGMPAIGIPASSIITSVQQKEYSAGIWLRRKDKLEHSQQKCIVIFALVCCFAVLVVLIFSAVDIWGEDEDGITEENCSRNCRAVLVENIPEDISFLDNGTSNIPLLVGLYNLLDRAIRVVEIVSPLWLLNSSDYESSFQPAARQVTTTSLCLCLLYVISISRRGTRILNLKGMHHKKLTFFVLCGVSTNQKSMKYYNPDR
uniref:Uncharacterized protein n=1 Tax=Cyclopterus lumpus TaxID=8103 RepID=A0A8C3GBZ5_CYCLU